MTSAAVIIAGGQIFKIAASRFVNVSEEEINLMKENAIPEYQTRHKVRNERNMKNEKKKLRASFNNC